MRMLDAERDQSVRTLQLYLTPSEAQFFRKELDRLLADPEASNHSHIMGDRDLSFSILTPRKLQPPNHYTELEKRVFDEP